MRRRGGGSLLLRGRITSDRMHRTVVVAVGRRVKHPICGKFVERVRRLHVHDPDGRGKLGDLVEIRSCRPISRTKFWQLVRVLGASPPAVSGGEE